MPATRPTPLHTLSDGDRRQLLEASDRLLDAIEERNLLDEHRVPMHLRRALIGLQERLVSSDRVVIPHSLRGAHDVVFTCQAQLMAFNPRRRAEALGSPHRQRAVKSATGDGWRLLALPAGAGAEWEALIEATVDRAFDRWCYAQHHAVVACRQRRSARRAVAVAARAWDNYWQLAEEAGWVLRRQRRAAA